MTALLSGKLVKKLQQLGEHLSLDSHVANYWLAQINPLLSLDEVRARVTAVHREAEFLFLTLQPNALWQGFRPGQHVVVSVEIEGRRHSRCYSICTHCGNQTSIELGIRRQGLVSGHLYDTIQVGTVLSLSQARGEFTLPEPAPEKMLFIAGGSGITPLYSMLQSALKLNPHADIALLYYGKNYARLPFAVEIQNLAFEHANFKLKFALTQCQAYDSDLEGHFRAAHLGWLSDFATRKTWVCGPSSLIESVQQHWQSLALPRPEQEYFQPALKPGNEPDTQFQLELESQHKQFTIKGAAPLLTQLEQAGVPVKSGCRMGICYECRCEKLSGTTRNLLTNELNTEPGSIQLCIHRAESDVTLAL